MVTLAVNFRLVIKPINNKGVSCLHVISRRKRQSQYDERE